MTFITPSKVYSHLDRLADWQAGGKPAPVTLEWDLSNRCSLGCKSCHFSHTHVRGPWAGKSMLPMAYENTGDLADPGMVANAILEARAAGVKGIVWSGGGEPTLHHEWVTLLRLAKLAGLKQGMYTLGGHIDELGAETLGACCEWVVVSLDACLSSEYAREKGVPESRFKDACDGIERLAKQPGLTVGVSFLLHGANWAMWPEMLAHARRLGATYTTFRPMIETETNNPQRVIGGQSWIHHAFNERTRYSLQRAIDEPDVIISRERFENYADWRGHGYAKCYGVRMSATVTPDGRVWYCPQRRGISGSCLGDLSKESFATIWSRHPGHYTVDGGCRAMCRLHQTNQVLDQVYAERQHEAFV